MTDSTHNHEPTPDFTEFLARDIARTFRHDARFAPSARVVRMRRLGIVLVSVTGTMAVLATGLVLGTNTGYASARVESDQQQNEIAANTTGITGQLAALRLELERTRAELTIRATEQGTPSRAVLEGAVAELREMAANVERIALDVSQNRTRVSAARSAPARSMPVLQVLSATLTALTIGEDATPVQQSIRTIDLAPATARTTEPLWNVGGVRQLPGGKLLVNDAGSRQVRIFDSTLAQSTVAVDSVEYGVRRPRSSPLIAFRGDSSLLADPRSQTIRVLDARGRIARTVQLPNVQLNLSGPGYADDKGRVVYSGFAERPREAGNDSVSLVRVDLASGRVDTVGRIKTADAFGRRLEGSISIDGIRDSAAAQYNLALGRRLTRARGDSSTGRYTFGFDNGRAQGLVPNRDDWAMLSDGTIALVRGHDYHVDWILPDGTARSTLKLPFDWQGLADENKRLSDKDAHTAAELAYTIHLRTDSTHLRTDSTVGRLRLVLDKLYETRFALNDFVFSGNFGDGGTARADADGNLWILPTATSADSARVYDVVRRSGELFQRARVPAGRSIAGFGKGGIVYLVGGDRAKGFFLERTKVGGQ